MTEAALRLLAVTFVLTAVGGWLYLAGEAGWAQFLWVLASGTAGAGVALLVDRR